MSDPTDTLHVPQKSRLLRAVAEVFVVALGILLAFAIDAGWGELQDAEQERLTLEALGEEFEANVTSLRRTAGQHESAAQASSQLLALTGPTVSDTAGVALLIGDIWIPYHNEVATSAIQSLLATNEFARVRDPELRQALAAWPGRVESLSRLEDGLHAAIRTRLLPLIQRHVPQIDIELVGGFADAPELRKEFTSAVSPSRFGSDLTLLLGDLEFENVVLDRMTVSMITRDFAHELAEEAEAILQLVERGLR